jgi:hypothetical protein
MHKTNHHHSVEDRYLLQPSNFWLGFLLFFGTRNAYERAITKIKETSEWEALRNDVRVLCEDSHKAISHSNILKNDKVLVDAC